MGQVQKCTCCSEAGSVVSMSLLGSAATCLKICPPTVLLKGVFRPVGLVGLWTGGGWWPRRLIKAFGVPLPGPNIRLSIRAPAGITSLQVQLCLSDVWNTWLQMLVFSTKIKAVSKSELNGELPAAFTGSLPLLCSSFLGPMQQVNTDKTSNVDEQINMS